LTKKRKILLIGVAVTLALVMTVGGLAQAGVGHKDVGGGKLTGVGEMGGLALVLPDGGQFQYWDTQFIITNPNCEQWLDIEWVSLIAGEDVYIGEYEDGTYQELWWYAEDVIIEGTPKDWEYYLDIEIPGNKNSTLGVLSPHEVWQVSIYDIIDHLFKAMYNEWDGDIDLVDIEDLDLDKYTLEVTWSGGEYLTPKSRKLGSRPLTGWQKEKCWFGFGGDGFPGFCISEAEMLNFTGRIRFSEGEPRFFMLPID